MLLMRFLCRCIVGASISAAASALAGCDSEPEEVKRRPQVAPAGPDGIQVIHAKNGDLIRLAGKVARIGEDAFLLDYGTGTITIVNSRATDMPPALQIGDEVAVAGRFDENPGGDRVVAGEVSPKRQP